MRHGTDCIFDHGEVKVTWQIGGNEYITINYVMMKGIWEKDASINQ